MRSDFEMLTFVALMLDDNFKFVEQSNEYTHKNHTEHRVTLGYLNGAWLVYQHQQSKVDELQKDLEEAALSQMKLYEENNVLQKRLDAVKQLVEDYKDPSITSDKSFQHGLLLVADELEQALKGGDNDQI